ncbi:MAG: hypothetical protein R3D02_08875 [Hyphomicrobiales bacterium]
MGNSMTDALSPLASRMPRVVREHEVLRVAGWMPGDEPAAVANAAIAEVLRWAQRRCGGQLPPEAWERKSFDYLSGGRNSMLRISSPERPTSGLFAPTTRTRPSPNGFGPPRVRWLAARPAREVQRPIASQQLRNQSQIEPHTPGFIQQVVENCRPGSTGRKLLSVAPAIHETEADAEDLIDYSDRSRPWHLPISW